MPMDLLIPLNELSVPYWKRTSLTLLLPITMFQCAMTNRFCR